MTSDKTYKTRLEASGAKRQKDCVEHPQMTMKRESELSASMSRGLETTLLFGYKRDSDTSLT